MNGSDRSPETLTDFLLARIAEREAAATAASGSTWRVELGGAILTDAGEEAGMIYAPADGEHIAHFDPARVLAECEAKRRIVEEFTPFSGATRQQVYISRLLFSLLALPYADHPDYRQEWKP